MSIHWLWDYGIYCFRKSTHYTWANPFRAVNVIKCQDFVLYVMYNLIGSLNKNGVTCVDFLSHFVFLYLEYPAQGAMPSHTQTHKHTTDNLMTYEGEEETGAVRGKCVATDITYKLHTCRMKAGIQPLTPEIRDKFGLSCFVYLATKCYTFWMIVGTKKKPSLRISSFLYHSVQLKLNAKRTFISLKDKHCIMITELSIHFEYRNNKLWSLLIILATNSRIFWAKISFTTQKS